MKAKVETLRAGSFDVELTSENQVLELRKAVAARLQLSGPECLKLVSGGQALHDKDVLRPNGSVLAVATPALPDPTLKRMAEIEASPADADEEDVTFRLPANASGRTRKLAARLRKCGVPDLMLIVIFQVKPTIWLWLLLWLVCAPLASWMEVGPLYVLGSIVAVIFTNLSQRKAGEASSYSIFNNFRNLPGQLTADELDRQVRTGQM